jgi:predicted dehydrogenase
MRKKYRVGIIGVCHVHVHNVATLFRRHPQVELLACADTIPRVPELSEAPYTRAWNRHYLVKGLGIPKAYDDYRQMLDREHLDIVICNSENSKHPEVVAACGAAGVHVCVEKPMAATLGEARQMVRAAESSGIKVLIHWYMPFSPLMRRAKALLDQGSIGRILEVKMRAAHAGPLAPGVRHPGPNIETAPMTGAELASTWWYQTAAGGGAMIDFCSYGAMVSRWFIGEPAVAAIGLRANLNSPWSDADDNGTIVARFSKAIGVFEGSWTTLEPGGPSGPTVYGTEGTLVVDERAEPPCVKIMKGRGQTTGFEGVALPENRQTVAEEFVHHLETGEPVHPTLDLRLNAEVMAILDAGVRSASSGRLELVSGPALPGSLVDHPQRGGAPKL